MKKLSILFIGLLLVTGLVFAQDVTIEGEASLTFGYDLDEEMSGFENAASSSISFDWLGGDAEKGTTGWITLSGWEIIFDADDDDGPLIVSVPEVEAGFLFEPITITIYSAPEFEGGNAEGFVYIDVDPEDADPRDWRPVALANKNTVADDDLDVEYEWIPTADLDGDEVIIGTLGTLSLVEETEEADSTTYQGLTITADLGVASLDLMFASDGTWENSNNDYAVGAVLTATVAPLDLTAEVWAGPFDAMDIGFSFGVDATVGTSIIGVGFDGWMADGSDELAYDASLLVGTGISGITLDVLTYLYQIGADDLDLDLEFVLGANDMVEGLGFTETFQTVNLMSADDNPDWYSLTELSYTVDGIMPYASFGINDASIIDLTAGVELSEMVENTVFTLEYAVDDVTNGNLGLITFDATISF